MSKFIQCILLFRSRVLILTTLAVFVLPAYGQSSTGESRVTLNFKNTPLKNVFSEITKQTKLYFLGNSDKLDPNERYTIKAESETINKVLTELLGNKGFIWTIKNNTVLIQRSNEKGLKNLVMRLNASATDSLITITGRVVNDKDEPIVGATIVVKGTKLGATSQQDGSFRVNGVPTNGVIVVSNIAYSSKEVKVGKSGDVGKVSLSNFVKDIDETVIVAYGKTTKRIAIGTVTSIGFEKIEQQPVTNVLYALQGRVPGLEIIPTTGLPGGAVNLQIRGRNSLNNLSQPLVVIDGIPIPYNIQGLGFNGASLQELSSLSFINPSDVESVSVLRDADATSIYGSRGANGVIIITTKKAKVGDTRLSIRFQQGVSDMNRRVDMMDTRDYLNLRHEAIANSGINVNEPPYNSDFFKLYHFADVTVWDSTRYTNWQDELLGGTAHYSDLQASISGGVPQIQYTVSANFHQETTIFPGENSDKRGGVHISLTGLTNDRKFQSTFTASYQVNNTTLPGIDFTGKALSLPPNAPALYKEGTLNWELLPSGSRSWNNPYSELFKTYESNVNNLISGIDISYKPISSLTLKVQTGYNKLLGNSFRKTFPFAGREPDLIGENANASFNRNGMSSLSFEPQLSFDTNFGKHSLTILLGGSYQSTDQITEVIDGQGASDDEFLKNLNSYTTLLASNTSSSYKYTAVFGRVSYSFNGKYLVNFSARRDGSSRFGPGRQFGNFGAIGAAWIVSEEHFLKPIRFISFAKLRATYGTSGNDGIGDYMYFERYSALGASRPYQGARGFQSVGIFNRNYAWETTHKLEGGLDINFLDNRINTSISIYRNRSNNQLIGYPYPSIVGPGNAVVNLPALIQNTGLEIVFATQIIKSKSFNWSTSINVTRNRNKLLKYPGSENSAFYTNEIGKPFYGLRYSFKSTKKVDPVTGKYQFIDKDGKITSSPDASDERGGQYYSTYVAPKYYGGISNTFTYNRFTLDFLFQFTKQIGNSSIAPFIIQMGRSYNVPKVFNDRWKAEGNIATFQKPYSNVIPFDYLLSNIYYGTSDVLFTDASFIRLKNASLSYSLPLSVIKKRKLADCKIFIQGQNLLTFTGYNGLDPETQSVGILPPLRTLIAGFQITL